MDWPPDYVAVFAERQNRLRRIRADPSLLVGALEYYATDPVAFINHWCVTVDPRNAPTSIPTMMPFVMFPKQDELVQFLHALVQGEKSGLIEKGRDMGATWVCCAFSAWLWRFWPGAAVGWGSRKEQLVDKIGVMDSIFEKIRTIIRNLPREFIPAGFNEKDHMTYMRVLNPENGAQIIGEAGDNIGRGGRTLIYFKDESAHYARPELIEAALADNTRVQVDISSVNGTGNVFHRRRESGEEWWQGKPLADTAVNVLVMDWSDHPAKDQTWYDARRTKAESEGLLHIFAQEVDRDYSAAIDGIIIPAAWVTSAIDAHIKLGFGDDGGYSAGLDVADEGGDKNALALVKGVVLQSAEAWGEGDVGKTARRAISSLDGLSVALQYDSIGVGAGVKAEANRLADDGELPDGASLIPWAASATCLDPDDHVIPGDDKSPINRDFYANLKAQGWWQLRLRFERTHRAITEGIEYPHDQLISLPSTLPNLSTVRKELSQATRGLSGAMRLVVNKAPPGTRSPNTADAIVMAYWPIKVRASIFDLL